jgi:hypothetical protein
MFNCFESPFYQISIHWQKIGFSNVMYFLILKTKKSFYFYVLQNKKAPTMQCPQKVRHYLGALQQRSFQQRFAHKILLLKPATAVSF